MGGSSHQLGITFSDSGATEAGYIYYNTGTQDLKIKVEDDVIFQSGSTETMRIDSSGNVGIGATSPSEALTVAGHVDLINTAINLNFMETGVTDSNHRIRQNAGNLYFQKLSDDKGTATDRIVLDGGTGNVGIGQTSPSTKLSITAGSANGIELDQDSDLASDSARLFFSSSSGGCSIFNTGGNLRFSSGATAGSSSGTERMRIDSSGMLLVNTTSSWGGETTPHIESRGDVAGDYTGLIVSNTNDAASDSVSVNFGLARDGGLVFGNAGKITVGKEQDWTTTASTVDGFMSFSTMQNESLTERMRITSSGGLEVGDGTNYGYLKVISDDAVTGYFDRRNGSGTILQFRLDDSTIGSLNIQSSTLQIGTGNTQLAFSDADDAFFVKNEAGTNRDGSHDLGKSSARFDDVFATNGTIQTSDKNEKQDIAELSDAETRVAVAAKELLRKFRWQSAVEEKGDEARIHFGIIAQDLQDAFTAEGLDASDYAMWCSDTWTDEDTGEERTRLGVRYSELLAFIIAAI